MDLVVKKENGKGKRVKNKKNRHEVDEMNQAIVSCCLRVAFPVLWRP